MPVGRTLAKRGLTLVGVLLAVLLLIVTVLGATGFSDKMLDSIISEQVRGIRQSLAETIRDPEALEEVVGVQRAELEEFYGRDIPWYFRLPGMASRVLILDLGSARVLRSFSGSSQVSDLILERLPNTVILVTTALLISAAIGIFLGTKLATKIGSRTDRITSLFSATSFALPTWWLGIMFILIFSFRLGIFPSGGLLSAPPPDGPLLRFLDMLWHAALPLLTLVLVSLGGWIYVTRTIVLNTAQEDFVTVARAKGLTENQVMRKYIIRVSIAPVLTNLILGLAGSFGGAILTETVFNWPGMGRLYYEAVLAVDESVIVALTFIFAALYVGARFILEVLYVVLDPRVRY